MVDLILASPGISQNALAEHFGYTASWVSQIISSDSFQARLAERTKDLVDPVVAQMVESRFKALVLRSQEILMEKLNRPTEEIPDQLALRALELSSRAAGYGGKVEQVGGPQLNVNLHLEDLGQNLVKLLRKKKVEAIDAEVEE
jgi:predicted transcriptional regulator